MILCQFILVSDVFSSIFIFKIAKFCYFKYENLNNVIIFAVEIEKTDTP